MPYAPSVENWTEEHYTVFGLIELVLGNREEVSKEDQEDMQFAEKIEELAGSGDPNWLQKVEEYMNSGMDLDNLPIDDMADDIDREQKARGQ